MASEDQKRSTEHGYHGPLFARRSVLKAGAALGGLLTVVGRAANAHAEDQNAAGGAATQSSADRGEKIDLDIPVSAGTPWSFIERRGQIVLIGINRPYIHNRIDPETYAGLAKAYYQYDHDPSLRAAVLFLGTR